MRPKPVTTPSAARYFAPSPNSCERFSTRRSTSSKLSSSSSSSMRSRAVSLPDAFCAAMRSGPPPASALRLRLSSSSVLGEKMLLGWPGLCGGSALCGSAILFSHPPPLAIDLGADSEGALHGVGTVGFVGQPVSRPGRGGIAEEHGAERIVLQGDRSIDDDVAFLIDEGRAPARAVRRDHHQVVVRGGGLAVLRRILGVVASDQRPGARPELESEAALPLRSGASAGGLPMANKEPPRRPGVGGAGRGGQKPERGDQEGPLLQCAPSTNSTSTPLACLG